MDELREKHGEGSITLGYQEDKEIGVELEKNYRTTITVNVQEDNPDAEGVGSDWESWSDF